MLFFSLDQIFGLVSRIVKPKSDKRDPNTLFYFFCLHFHVLLLAVYLHFTTSCLFTLLSKQKFYKFFEAFCPVFFLQLVMLLCNNAITKKSLVSKLITTQSWLKQYVKGLGKKVMSNVIDGNYFLI